MKKHTIYFLGALGALGTTGIVLSPGCGPRKSQPATPAPKTPDEDTTKPADMLPSESQVPQCRPSAQGMAQIPEGSYRMGSTPEQLKLAMRMCLSRKQDCRPSWWKTERPAHWVSVSAYKLDKTEVTQQEYQTCVGGGACKAPDESQCSIWDPSSAKWITGPKLPKRLQGPNKPVVCVTWQDADRFCKWRGGRLPSELEWERAVRGNDGRLYPWGDTPYTGARANGCDASCGEIAGRGWRVERNINDGVRFLADVGSFPQGQSPYGIMDAAGNVWEWTKDWYDEDYYAISERKDPPGPESGEYRAVRGGSWSNESDSMRSAFRYSLSPTTRSTAVGFRCACDAAQ